MFIFRYANEPCQHSDNFTLNHIRFEFVEHRRSFKGTSSNVNFATTIGAGPRILPSNKQNILTLNNLKTEPRHIAPNNTLSNVTMTAT